MRWMPAAGAGVHGEGAGGEGVGDGEAVVF